jgi:uncharacterized SAM-binding protein YcdF (DUF218 family)
MVPRVFVRVIESLLVPPGCCLLLLLFGTLVRRRRPRLGRSCQVLGILLLWAAATPWLATSALRFLQTEAPLPPSGDLPAAQAIVVLSAEADRDGSEYGYTGPGALTLQRLRYAAFLQKRTGLPVLTSGGRPGHDTEPLSDSMARTLEQEFGTAVRWREDRSADTWENAVFSAERLKQDGVQKILLVTHAFHMPRAARSFRAQGLEVVSAPTAFRGAPQAEVHAFLPSATAVRDTGLFLHESIGAVWYWLRH